MHIPVATKGHKNLFVALANHKRVDGSTLCSSAGCIRCAPKVEYLICILAQHPPRSGMKSPLVSGKCFYSRHLLTLIVVFYVGRGRHAFAHDRAGHISPSSTVTATFGNANNPRLPPYPHPTVVCAAIQIRHRLAIPGIGSGPAGGTCANSGTGVKARMATGQGATGLDSACVAACFASGRGFFAGSPPSGVAGLSYSAIVVYRNHPNYVPVWHRQYCWKLMFARPQ